MSAVRSGDLFVVEGVEDGDEMECGMDLPVLTAWGDAGSGNWVDWMTIYDLGLRFKNERLYLYYLYFRCRYL